MNVSKLKIVIYILHGDLDLEFRRKFVLSRGRTFIVCITTCMIGCLAVAHRAT